jgi:hypothetical protein
MRTILFAILAVAGSISTAAFAADNQIQAESQDAKICRPGRPGVGESIPPDNPRPVPPECRQPARTASVVAERALAQTGLAIGLASTVLQSQIAILEAIVEQSTSCVALSGGGSVLANGSGTSVTVYYGANCTQPYIMATPNTTTTNDSFVIAETAVYYGLNGTDIGTMTLNETATFNDDGSVNLYGLGIFTPASGARAPVQLGLYCAIPTSNSAQCAGGIAQNFPSLGLAIGAVTPLTLSLDLEVPTAPVTFTGGGSTVTGPVGSLTLTNPGPTSLVIHGGTAFATTVSSGGAAEFSLFPPTPTAWTLTDSAHEQEFSISVVSNTARNLSLKIAQVGKGGTLAIGAIDQSGSGSITYSDGSTAAITNWTLAN